MNDFINNEVSSIRICFSSIQKEKGKKKEECVLLCNQVKNVFDALCLYLNPMITFHLGEKSFSNFEAIREAFHTKNIPQRNEYISDTFDFLTFVKSIANKHSINLQDMVNINGFLEENLNEENIDFAKAFLCKKIKLGITEKTINKIFDREIIPEFRCMLANKYFDNPKSVEGKDFFLTEKLDGIRCICYAKTGEIPLFYSRQGQLIEGMTNVENDIKKIIDQCGISLVFDGELLISNRDGIPSKTQYKYTTNIVRTEGVKTGITYNIFDVISYDRFVNKCSFAQYSARRSFLDTLNDNNPDLHAVSVLPVLYHGNDTNEIMKCLDQQRKLQHEGVMINIASDLYQFTRTNSLLKVKVMQDCDLKIIDFQEGKGKFENTLGSLIVDYKGNPVGVGSGLSDKMRKTFWENRTKFLGRIVKVQYFEETQDVNGNKSIRFPVFVELCEEGKEISYS